MNVDLPAMLRRLTRITFFFLSIGCIGFAVWPDYKPYFGGFMIGVIGGLIGSFHLAWKVSRIGDLAAAGRKSRSGLGFLSRAAIGVLAALVSVEGLHFNLAATAAGILALPLVTLLLGLLSSRRLRERQSADERGEK
ncbi:ATP synthase subunit I [Cohnella endophytica]|uniref:ATP synthase subunit I n=1 Tax=Cohnella endophytica TaxID=2419778 RepID=A0A494XGU4_9BACL|nr:ATP synthase subunit I [Cohnella endophytica]RKP47314.1 ATP synthase subunit I [Cohnella endophytica]